MSEEQKNESAAGSPAAGKGGALRTVVKVLLWTLAAVVALLLALPLWIGPVAKGVANAVVPGITGTPFRLGEFGLNPYAGTLHVGDMQLANPTNFSEKNAVELGSFDADLAVTSLFGGRKVRIESVDLDGLVVYSDATASNFRQIAANAAGGPKEASEPSGKPAEEPAAKPEPAPKEGGKGAQIDRLTIRNVTVRYGMIPLKIPVDIVMTDIGRESEDGASLQEVVQLVWAKILSAGTAVGGKLGDLGKGVIDAAGNIDVDAAKDAIKGVGGTLKDAAGAVDLDSAKDALKGAGDGIKNLFK